MVVQQLFQLLVSVAHPAEGKISRPHKLHLRQCLGNLRKLQHPFAGLQLTGTDNGSFRLIINDVNCKKTEKPMPKLPVATAFWTPEPNLQTGAEAWILAGGAHHTAFSYDLTAEQMGDWANSMGIEAVYIDKDTTIRQFNNELKWNSIYYR